ncbi:RICIN domain-containing protein [Streptomyces phaeofaciens JCM 4814]|uniref:Hydrolase n=1 Tax=Streptomyces phaeofaciens TaxID=68254 RepID=A0A918HJY9_9ACTN|nr:RICIN domain-containing protein [Streptomyces phaeofaciens]GGT69168.1 hydrolase [Streptomyces phaeofaciens]
MHSPNPPRPPYPPRPGWTPGESDAQLAARLARGDGIGHAVALLLARHWRAAHDYAAVCLATEDSARLVAAAAFHTVFGRLADGRPCGALRPQLLVAVRETVREWAGSDGVSAVLPELRKTVGGRGLRAARPGTPERRQLAEHAFRSLPAASQCLLWHVEVEAEPLSVPAGLLGIDGMTAAAALEQAREQFRAGCVRAHRELAPAGECRFNNRLLDVPLRRGGTLLPEVRQHLARCRYCRHAAEQLSHFDGGLDMLLAETVLGWGARRYRDSRPGRAGSAGRPDRPAPLRRTGRHRTTSAGLLDLPGRRPKAVLVGVGLTTLALLATVLVTKGWTDDNGVPDPRATWGAPAGGSTAPGTDGASTPGADARPPAGSPSAASAAHPAEVAHGRLRSTDTGRCLDVEGGRTVPGAAAVLRVCSGGASQQWSYGGDGLLHSAAAPTLCLAADPGRGAVALAGCVVHAGEAFFDLTVRGELLLRRDDGLAVTPGTGAARAAVVVRERDGSARQRWAFEAPAGTTAAPAPDGAPPAGDPPPAHSPEPARPRPAPPLTPDADPAPAEPAPLAPGSETRIAQVHCCGTPAPDRPATPAGPVGILGALPAPGDVVGDLLGDVVTGATAGLGG